MRAALGIRARIALRQRPPQLAACTATSSSSSSSSCGSQPVRASSTATTTTSGPPGWRTVYDLIAQHRANGGAPVDSMGCERQGDRSADPRDFRFQTLVALMLSSMTKDQMVHQAMNRLKDKFRDQGGLSAKNVAACKESELEAAIAGVGFPSRKAGYLKAAAQRMVSERQGDIPPDIESLCELPGVGPKMAHLAMSCAWESPVGVGVDVHVHRISNRLGWAKQTQEPEETRVQLEKFLPPDLWGPVNPMLVGFGQTVCSARSPDCEHCPVLQLCPTGPQEIRRRAALAAAKAREREAKRAKQRASRKEPKKRTNARKHVEVRLEDAGDAAAPGSTAATAGEHAKNEKKTATAAVAAAVASTRKRARPAEQEEEEEEEKDRVPAAKRTRVQQVPTTRR